MNLAPHEVGPSRSMFPESLGRVSGRGRLQGRRVQVIGAGQRVVPEDAPPIGIGRTVSVLFAREGAKLVCVDISEQAARAPADQIRHEGGLAFVEVADVCNPPLIQPVVQRAREAMGGLDGLVLNVAIFNGLPLDKITVESWDGEDAVNLRSHMLFARLHCR